MIFLGFNLFIKKKNNRFILGVMCGSSLLVGVHTITDRQGP